MPKHRLVAPRGKGGRKAILDARHDRTFMKLSKLVDKEEWQDVLGHFPENAKAEKLLALLSNPLFARATIGKLAVMSGMPAAELILLFTSAKKAEGIIRMGRKLPDIMEATADDALPHREVCPRCNGEKRFTIKGEQRDCGSCGAKGYIIVKGDMDNRKLVFEVAGLTGRRVPGAAIQINVGGSQSLETRVGLAQQLLAEPSVEGEVVNTEDIEEPAAGE
jgi:hypothetical protein